MSILKSGVAICAALLLGACAAGTTGGSGAGASSTAGSAVATDGGPAASMNISVTNTIVRVANIPNEALLRAELEEFKSGLFWARGLRPTDAVINIGGEADRTVDGEVEGVTSEFGQSVLFGTVSLVDAQTGDVVIPPIRISVQVGSNRDTVVGLTEGSKAAVELEYLVQKFILAGREALYGKGV